MPKKLPKKLPKKMSGLIRVAIADLKAVEKLKKTYRVDMSTFHTPNSHCSVCLAGAVIARTFGEDPTREVGPSDFSWEVSKQLWALDILRHGLVMDAFEEVDKGFAFPRLQKHDLETFPITPYADDPKAFKRDFLKLANRLDKIGL